MADTARSLSRTEDNSDGTTAEERAASTSRSNAIRRLVRCLFAERIFDRDRVIAAPGSPSACLPFWEKEAVIVFSDLWLAPASSVINNGDIVVAYSDGRRFVIATPADLVDAASMLADLTGDADGIANLKSDIANSTSNDAAARIFRERWNASLQTKIQSEGSRSLSDYLRRHSTPREAAIVLDQWGALEGHSFHPTWKARPNLEAAEVQRFSPEFKAEVSVRIAALRVDAAHVETMPHVASCQSWFSAHFPQAHAAWKTGLEARDLSESDWLPLPLHSWHLDAFVREEYAREIADGLLITDGPDILARPSMSFRTMVPHEPDNAAFIKLPVAIWMTSEQRSLQAKSIHMGPQISSVLQQIIATEHGFGGMLNIFPEAIGIHYRKQPDQDDAPGRYLSVVFRETEQALSLAQGELAITAATLRTGLPGSGRPFATSLIDGREGEGSNDAVEAFFRDYVRVITRPVIAVYMIYGIALEAHEQNTTVVFSADGKPKSIILRDFGDVRAYRPWLERHGLSVRPYTYPGILPTVFDGEIDPVRVYTLDATFINHLHEMALMLTSEYEVHSERLWEIMREETEAAFDGVAERVSPADFEREKAAFLDQDWPTRSLLKMHVQRYKNYRIYHHLENPLRRPV